MFDGLDPFRLSEIVYLSLVCGPFWYVTSTPKQLLFRSHATLQLS